MIKIYPDNFETESETVGAGYVYMHGLLEDQFKNDIIKVDAASEFKEGINTVEVAGCDLPCTAYLWIDERFAVDNKPGKYFHEGKFVMWTGYRGLIVRDDDVKGHAYAQKKFQEKSLIF